MRPLPPQVSEMADHLGQGLHHAMQESHALADKIAGLLETIEAEKASSFVRRRRAHEPFRLLLGA